MVNLKRKVIKQGHNTLTVTLPSKWAEKLNIKPGDEVDLIEQGKDLKISSEKKDDGTDVAVVDISGLIIPSVWRFVSSAYRAGYDEIKIIFENKGFSREIYTAFTYDTIQLLNGDDAKQLSPIEAIQALVNRFIGFEIIEQKPNYCVIKDLGHTTSKEFDNTLKRIFLLLQTMSEAVLETAKEGKREGLKGINIIDTNLDRFEDFCLRIINKEGCSDFRKVPTMHTLIFLLELVGDEYKRLGLHMLKMKSISKNVIKFLENTDKLIRAYYDLYYDFSKEKTDYIYKLDFEDAKLYDRMKEGIIGEDAELLHHIKKIDRFIISLVELRVDMIY